MKKYLSTILIAFVIALTASAQDVKRPETYNYLRGLEAMQNEKYYEAIEYFNKDIKENPKSGYPYSWLAFISNYLGDNGHALTAADMAIKLLPKKDPVYTAFAYATRAKCHLALEDTTKAINDYASAIKIQPEEEDLYKERAEIYYRMKQYDLADADYKKITDINPGSVIGYMGLGRNANAQERWEDAIKQFNYVEKFQNNYSSIYSFRAESYVGLKKYSEATDDIIAALNIDGDQKAFDILQNLDEEAYPIMKAKLKIQMTKNPNDFLWPYYLGALEEQNKKYKSAVDYYMKSNDIESSPIILKRIASCFTVIGDHDRAIEYIDKGLALEPSRYDLMLTKSDALYESGRYKEAVEEMDEIISLYPEWGWLYYQRGWIQQHTGMKDKAIEDYDMAIILSPKYSYSYFCRGRLYLEQGNTEKAKKDFEKVIELETESGNYSCIQYAYYYLGYKEKAVEYQNKIMQTSDDDENYDAACLYSLMGETETAIDYLAKALKNGYNNFHHIEVDTDLDNIRQTDRFKNIIKEYKEKTERDVSEMNEVSSSYESNRISGTTEIPFTKENGVTKVKCEINDLPLHFVFDTGASTVSLSMVEATFMLKNGYISKDDIVGSQNFMDANGNVSVGTIIILRSVKFGGAELNNVRASVVGNQVAPLLLGQSVLGRLGRIEIDNRNMVIRISDTNTPTTTNNKRTSNWGNLAPPPPPPPPPPAETSSSTTSESPVTVAVAAPPGTIVVAGPPGDPVNSSDDSSETILETVDVQPAFPGGLNGLLAFIQENIVYPKKAQKNYIQGTVQIKFVVNKEGYVVNPVVLKSLDPDCDKEAIRVISAMPRWKPGIKDGKKVNCYFSVPISFTLK